MTQPAAARLTGSVQHMCFITVDGERALAAARNQGIELIIAADGTALRAIAADRTATAIVTLPGDHDVLLAGSADGTVYGYDPATGRQLFSRVLGAGSVRDIAVFEGIVAGVLDSGVYLWPAGTDTVTRLPDPYALGTLDPSRLFKVCVFRSAGRQMLACAYTDGYLATWNLDNPDAEPSVQRAHDGPVWSLIATDDDAGEPLIVTGGSDRRMRTWSPKGDADLRARQTFVADGTIRRLGHVSDKQTTMLITASATGSVSLWRLDGSPDRPEIEVSRHLGEVWALACATTDDGVLIASGDMNGEIEIKRLSTALLTETTITVLYQTQTTIWAVAHGDTPDGPYVACAGVDQTVNVIDPAGRRAAIAMRRHSSTVRALVATGDRDRPHLISGGADHRVLDWNPHNGDLRAELPMGHQGEVWALASYLDSDGYHVVSGSADGTVRAIALDGDAEARILATDCGEVNTVVALPVNGEVVVVAGSGKGLRALSTSDGSSRVLSLPAISAACGVQDAGRQLVVAARQDGVVQLIDPIAGATVSTFAISYGTGQVRALDTVEVAGTRFVLGGCDDGRVLVWHIDGTLVSKPVRGGTAGIRSMDVVEIVRPAGGQTQSALITAGHDGAVRLWPVTMDSPLRSGGSVGREVRPASILLQDQPTGDDLLSRAELVDALHDALRAPATEPPLVVGVHAPWGQGKSSLLRQLKTRVDPWVGDVDPPSHRLVPTVEARRSRWRRNGNTVRTRLTRAWAWGQIDHSGDRNAPLEYEMRPLPGTKDPISVWFNPWMYESTEQIWSGLTREILDSVTGRLSKGEQERLWFDLNLRRTDPGVMRKRILATYIPRTLLGALAGGLLLVLVAMATVAMAVAAVNSPSVVSLLGPTTLVMLTVLGTVAQLTRGSFKHIHGWVSQVELNSMAGSEYAPNQSPDPLTSAEGGYLYLRQHDVDKVVELATRHEPLYIFIDDLDRCAPRTVADTVEAINLFLNRALGHCVFVIALDLATVSAHLETALKDINDRAKQDPASFGHLRHIGWRFMEKIIDLPIRLPRVRDTALSDYLDRLLDTVPAPSAGPATPPAAEHRPGTARREPEPQAVPAATVPANGETRANVELVVVPDTPTSARGIAEVEDLEAVPPVREALRKAVLSLPARNPRQAKAFVNLWRFYMVLDHRMGLFSPSLLAVERHSIEMARLVELMVRWPYLLDLLGEPAAVDTDPTDSVDQETRLDRLLDACGPDDEVWAAEVRRARLDPDDLVTHELRDLLRRALPHRQVFTSIARRYL